MNTEPRPAERRGLAPVAIVVPSLVSGLGIVFLLAAFFVNHEIVRGVFFSLGAILLWADFFITMAVLRYTVRNIDRRLRRIEERLPRD